MQPLYQLKLFNVSENSSNKTNQWFRVKKVFSLSDKHQRHLNWEIMGWVGGRGRGGKLMWINCQLSVEEMWWSTPAGGFNGGIGVRGEGAFIGGVGRGICRPCVVSDCILHAAAPPSNTHVSILSHHLISVDDMYTSSHVSFAMYQPVYYCMKCMMSFHVFCDMI